MTGALDELLSRPKGRLAIDAADAVCLLIIQASLLGELRDTKDDGSRGAIRADRLAHWFGRLNRAVENDAFGPMTAKQIVDRILTLEPEAKPTPV